VQVSRNDPFKRLKAVFRDREGLGRQSGSADAVPGTLMPLVTSPTLVGEALERYRTAALANAGNDDVSKAIRSGLLIDIYWLTGTSIKRCDVVSNGAVARGLRARFDLPRSELGGGRKDPDSR